MTSDSVVKLSVNGLEQQVLCPPQETLLETLREIGRAHV